VARTEVSVAAAAGWVASGMVTPPAAAVCVAMLPSSACKVLIALSTVGDNSGSGVDADNWQPVRLTTSDTSNITIMNRAVLMCSSLVVHRNITRFTNRFGK
jgi:hypothetical protein